MQETVGSGALGLTLRTDLGASTPAGNPSPAATLAGVTVWRPDWNVVLADLDADLAAYQKATGS